MSDLHYRRRKNAERRAAGQCLKCGAPLNRGGTATRCAACRVRRVGYDGRYWRQTGYSRVLSKRIDSRQRELAGLLDARGGPNG
jgi:hypothetical protein